MRKFPQYFPPYKYFRPFNYSTPPVTQPIQSKNVTSSQTSKSKDLNSPETIWLDLFGIKLYFDDVLIIGLLFFLYKEEVKDEGLFLALILLLIS